MKKNLLISCITKVLVFCLLFVIVGFVSVKAFAVRNDLVYVSIGDSMTNGYGLDGYYDVTTFKDEKGYSRYPSQDYGVPTNKFLKENNVYGYQINVPYTYPYYFCKYLENEYIKDTEYEGVYWEQLAISAMRPEEFVYIMTDKTESEIDKLNSKTLFSKDKKEVFEKAIKYADVISFALGDYNFSCTISSIINNQSSVSSMTMEKLLLEYNPEIKELASSYGIDVKAVYDYIVNVIKKLLLQQLGEEEVEAILNIADKVAYSFVGFMINYSASIKIINNLKKDSAKLIILGMYNFFEGMTASYNGKVINLGDIFQVITELTNAYRILFTEGTVDAIFVNVPRDSKVLIDDLVDGNKDTMTLVKSLGYVMETINVQSMIDDLIEIDLIPNLPESSISDLLRGAQGFAAEGSEIYVAIENLLGENGELSSKYLTNDRITQAMVYYLQTGNIPVDNPLTLEDEGFFTNLKVILNNALVRTITNDYELPLGLSLTKPDECIAKLFDLVYDRLLELAVKQEIKIDVLAKNFSNISKEDISKLLQNELNNVLEGKEFSETAKIIGSVYLRCLLGDASLGHYSKAAHKKIADAMIYAFKNDMTVEVIIKKKVEQLLMYGHQCGVDLLNELLDYFEVNEIINESLEFKTALTAEIQKWIEKIDRVHNDAIALLVTVQEGAEALVEFVKEYATNNPNETVVRIVMVVGKFFHHLDYDYGALFKKLAATLGVYALESLKEYIAKIELVEDYEIIITLIEDRIAQIKYRHESTELKIEELNALITEAIEEIYTKLVETVGPYEQIIKGYILELVQKGLAKLTEIAEPLIDSYVPVVVDLVNAYGKEIFYTAAEVAANYGILNESQINEVYKVCKKYQAMLDVETHEELVAAVTAIVKDIYSYAEEAINSIDREKVMEYLESLQEECEKYAVETVKDFCATYGKDGIYALINHIKENNVDDLLPGVSDLLTQKAVVWEKYIDAAEDSVALDCAFTLIAEDIIEICNTIYIEAKPLIIAYCKKAAYDALLPYVTELYEAVKYYGNQAIIIFFEKVKEYGVFDTIPGLTEELEAKVYEWKHELALCEFDLDALQAECEVIVEEFVVLVNKYVPAIEQHAKDQINIIIETMIMPEVEKFVELAKAYGSEFYDEVVAFVKANELDVIFAPYLDKWYEELKACGDDGYALLETFKNIYAEAKGIVETILIEKAEEIKAEFIELLTEFAEAHPELVEFALYVYTTYGPDFVGKFVEFIEATGYSDEFEAVYQAVVDKIDGWVDELYASNDDPVIVTAIFEEIYYTILNALNQFDCEKAHEYLNKFVFDYIDYFDGHHSVYEHNNKEHWKHCTYCGLTGEKEPHNIVWTGNKGKCVCGYEVEVKVIDNKGKDATASDGLYKEAKDQGQGITLSLNGTVAQSEKTAIGANSAVKDIIAEINAQVEGTKKVNNVVYADITIKLADGTVLTETSNVIEVPVKYVAGEKVTKLLYKHLNEVSEFKKLTAKPTNPVHGTYYVDETNGIVYIYTNKFSTCAIFTEHVYVLTYVKPYRDEQGHYHDGVEKYACACGERYEHVDVNSHSQVVADELKEATDLINEQIDLLTDLIALDIDDLLEALEDAQTAAEAAIEDLNNKITAAEAAIGAAKAEADAKVAAAKAEATAAIANLTNKMTELANAYKAADTALENAYKAADTTLENAYKAADSQLEEAYKAAIAAAKAEVANNFDAAKNEMTSALTSVKNALEASIATVSNNLEKSLEQFDQEVAASLAALILKDNDILDKVDAAKSELTAAIAAAEAAYEAADTVLAGEVDTKLASLKAELQAIIAASDSSITDAEKEIKQIKDRVAELEAQIAAANNTIDKLSGKTNALLVVVIVLGVVFAGALAALVVMIIKKSKFLFR